MTSITSLRSFYSILTLAFIFTLSFQVSSKTFRWTDRGTATNTNNDREYRVTIKYRVEIDEIDICTIKLHVNAKMKGKNSRGTTSYSTYVDGDSVGLSYGQTFSYTRPENRSGKMFMIDGYNNLKFKNEKVKFLKDVHVVKLRNKDFDLYDQGEELDELNRYTEKLSAKCKIHETVRLKKRDAAFKTQRVPFNTKESTQRTKQAIKYLTSEKYIQSVDYTIPQKNPYDGKVVIAIGKSRSNEKGAAIKLRYSSTSKTDDIILDDTAQACVKRQKAQYFSFYKRNKEDDEKNKRYNWMNLLHFKQPVFHLLDSRETGNIGTYRAAYIDNNAKWHIYFVLGKPSSRHDELKNNSECFVVHNNDFFAQTNEFWSTTPFKKALTKLTSKFNTGLREYRRKRAAKNNKQLIQQFKKTPKKMLAALEKDLKIKLSKLDAKMVHSDQFQKEIKSAQKTYLNLLNLIKISHPQFYKDNMSRFKNANWYKRYLKSEK